MSDMMFYGVLRMPYELAMGGGEINRLQFYSRVQECATRCEQAESALEELREAVSSFIRAKGRFHTEQGYKSLVDAFDKSGPNVQSSLYGAAKHYMESSEKQRERIDDAIKQADSIINAHRESRDRRKIDVPYQASGLPDRRQADRRNKNRG